MGATTPQCRGVLALARAAVLASGSPDAVGATDFGDFGAHQLQGFPARTCPCPTLRVRRYRRPHMVRGQDGSLLLSCMTLAFTASRRFIPTHPGVDAHSIYESAAPSQALFLFSPGAFGRSLGTLPIPSPAGRFARRGSCDSHPWCAGEPRRDRRSSRRPTGGATGPSNSIVFFFLLGRFWF